MQKRTTIPRILNTDQEQERCNIMEGLFTTFNNKFQPQHNDDHKVITIPQVRQANE